MFLTERNWVFDTNFNFLIPKYLQTNVVDLKYFKLLVMLDQIVKVWISKVYIIRLKRRNRLSFHFSLETKAWPLVLDVFERIYLVLRRVSIFPEKISILQMEWSGNLLRINRNSGIFPDQMETGMFAVYVT